MGKTRDKTRNCIEEELERQLNRCKAMEFQPFDTGLYNTIWVPKKEKL